MTVADGDIVRITANMDHTLEGDVQNVYHSILLGGNATDLQYMQVAAVRLEACYAYLQPYMPDTLLFEDVRGFNITQDKPLPTVDWPTLAAGTVDVADPLPSVMSVLCFQRTGMSRVIGKKYYGPFTEADQSDAVWTSGLLAAVALGFNLLTVGATAGTGTLSFGVFSPTLSLFQFFQEFVIPNVPAYQRRRRRGRGS